MNTHHTGKNATSGSLNRHDTAGSSGNGGPVEKEAPHFERIRIGHVENPTGGPFGPKAAMNLLCLAGDLTGNGRPDIVIAPRHGRMVWFENPGPPWPGDATGGAGAGSSGGPAGADNAAPPHWPMHILDEDVQGIEAGGALADVTGNGLLDVIAGGDGRNDQLYWWENPGRSGGKWRRRVIVKTGFWQFHDQAVGVVTPDGVTSLVFWNNRVGDLYRVPIPQDPTVSPWPDVELIRRGNPNEGIAIGDVDGDGINEIVAGDSWYKFVSPDRGWVSHVFSHNYPYPRLQLADLDGDGKLEIIAAEGDAHIFGDPEGGRAGWLKAPEDPRELWEEHVLEEKLLDSHTLQVGDFTGDGRPDIAVAEIGIPDNPRRPRFILYANSGKGAFRRHVIEEGLSNHEGRAADVTGSGRLDLVAKPLLGDERWDVFVYVNRTGS